MNVLWGSWYLGLFGFWCFVFLWLCFFLCVGFFLLFSSGQISTLFQYREETRVLGYALLKHQTLFHFLLRFSHSKSSFRFNAKLFKVTLDTSKQSAVLLILILLMFDMVFCSVFHISVNAYVEWEGRSICVFEGYRIHFFLCGKVRMIMWFCVIYKNCCFILKEVQNMFILVQSGFFMLFFKDHLLFYLLFIATKKILYKNSFCQCKEL